MFRVHLLILWIIISFVGPLQSKFEDDSLPTSEVKLSANRLLNSWLLPDDTFNRKICGPFRKNCPSVIVLGTTVTLAQTDFNVPRSFFQPTTPFTQADCLPGRILVTTSPRFNFRFLCDIATGNWGRFDPTTTPICFVGTAGQPACPDIANTVLNTVESLTGPTTVESQAPQVLRCSTGFTPRGLPWERFTCNFNTGTWDPNPNPPIPYCDGANPPATPPKCPPLPGPPPIAVAAPLQSYAVGGTDPIWCVPKSNNIDLRFGSLIVTHGIEVTLDQVKEGPTILFFDQGLNRNYVVGIWDMDAPGGPGPPQTAVLYGNDNYRFGTGCDNAPPGVQWDPNRIVSNFANAKEAHRIAVFVWDTDIIVPSIFTTPDLTASGPAKIETALPTGGTTGKLRAPIAGMWFRVLNPCHPSDFDCIQCRRVMPYNFNGQQISQRLYPQGTCNPWVQCNGFNKRPGVCNDNRCDTDTVPCDAALAPVDDTEIGRPCVCNIAEFNGSIGRCNNAQFHQCVLNGRVCSAVPCTGLPTYLPSPVDLPCNCGRDRNRGKIGVCTRIGTCTASNDNPC